MEISVVYVRYEYRALRQYLYIRAILELLVLQRYLAGTDLECQSHGG